jgi:hypothetical protein
VRLGPYHRVELTVHLEGPRHAVLALLDQATTRPVDLDTRTDWSDFSLRRLDPVPDELSNDYTLNRYGRLCAVLLLEPPGQEAPLLPRDPCYCAALGDLMDDGAPAPRTVAECRDALLQRAPAAKLNPQQAFDPVALGQTYLDLRARRGYGTREEWIAAHWGTELYEESSELVVMPMDDGGLSVSLSLAAEEYFPVRYFERLTAHHPVLRVVVNFTAENVDEEIEREVTWECSPRAAVRAPSRRTAGLGG